MKKKKLSWRKNARRQSAWKDRKIGTDLQSEISDRIRSRYSQMKLQKCI